MTRVLPGRCRYLEDPELAERFEMALPSDTLARALQLVDDLRHVHPLAVAAT